MRPAVGVLALAMAVAATVAVAGLSRVPLHFASQHDALLRLSWRVDGLSVEECRQMSDAELANLPVHMRNPEACIGRIAPYRLQVAVDGLRLVDDTIRPGGARGDRPIYVLSDFPVDAGEYRIQLRFEAILPTGSTWLATAVPVSMDRRVTLESGDIVLVTLDDDTHEMVVSYHER
jgi:hypothetical protein